MIFFFRAIRSPSSSRAPRRGGAAFLTFGAFQNFRRNPLYNPAKFPIIIQKLRVIQFLLSASTFSSIQFALKFRNFLLQGSVFSSCVRKSDFVLVKLGLHSLHAGDKPFQQGFNFLQFALGVEYICVIHNRFHFLALLGKMGHFFEHTRRNVLAVGLIGAFAAFKVRILADHVFPIGTLPLAQFSLLSILKDIKKDMDEKEPTSPPVQMEFLKKLMDAIEELSLPKNPPSPEKAVDWTISQIAKQVPMSAETRKAYKRAFMMSLHDNGKAQGKK